MLTFQCGVCRTQLQTPEDQAGKLVRCAKCQTTLRVPEPIPTAAVASGNGGRPPTPSMPPPVPSAQQTGSRPMGGRRYGFNCQYCSSRLEAVESMAGQEGSCPTCGNAIIIPILDRYGRLIDPMTGKVVKQDPHPVHAYAANGERAPKILRREDGSQAIQCSKCRTLSPITSNNCKSCGMPFTMEGTTAEAAGAANGFAVAGLVLGIIGIPAGCTIIVPVLALVFACIGYAQTRDNATGGRGVAIAGIVCGAIGCAIGLITIVGEM
jgi:LSD1 subclass zinc finger protein